MTEKWKSIEKYNGLYEISSYGRVKSLITNKILKAHRPSVGYYKVALYMRGDGKTFTIHRLVAKEFIPNNKNKPCVNHKDGDKTNNCVENLEWCTYKENSQHAFKTGLLKLPAGGFSKENPFIWSMPGTRHPKAK